MSLPLPDDAKVTLTVGQLRAMLEGRTAATFVGIGTKDAANITGEDERTLRRRWVTWDRIQREGGRPEVRVSRKGASPRSDLLFDRSDCYAYRDRPKAGPLPADDDGPAGDPNDVEAIVERLLSQI